VPSGNPETQFDSVTAKRAAEASKKARQRAARDPMNRVRRELPNLFGALLRAVNGQGEYHDLAPDKRLTALFKAIEYSVGKPVGLDKASSGTGNKEDGDAGGEDVGGLEVR
jgi:hypothetical protein